MMRSPALPGRRPMRQYAAAIVMLMGVAFGGCATSVGTIAAGHNLDTSGESVVVGRVEIVKADGRPLTPAPDLLVGRVSLTAKHETSGKTYMIDCDARGFISDFYVSLPVGRYRIIKAATSNLVSHFRASFEVAAREVAYVGTFRFTGGSGLNWQSGAWEVVDEPEATLPAFRERYPQLKQAVTRSIAVM